jgi:hypothetical protein
METTHHIQKENNLMALKLSLPMWSNEEINLEITELKAYIQDLTIAGQGASYFKNKLSLLEQALRTRG